MNRQTDRLMINVHVYIYVHIYIEREREKMMMMSKKVFQQEGRIEIEHSETADQKEINHCSSSSAPSSM